MDITPEKKLLEAIVKQAIKDYIKLNPESKVTSAEFFEDEASDYKTAEGFIFKNQIFSFGSWDLTFEDICLILDIDTKRVKKFIFSKQVDYKG
jgi:hypothetical protein